MVGDTGAGDSSGGASSIRRQDGALRRRQEHPVFKGIEGEWPRVLGYNKSILKPEAELAATVCGDPFIAFAGYGKGKTAVFSSDCSPHWAPLEFCNWKYYNLLFKNMIDYIVN